MKKILSLVIISIAINSISAQRTIESSSDIFQEIKKLNVVTNVLYIAAHPDDENTRLIAWLENEKLARTAYLSLTRGDGGQNLVGTEKGDAMGVLRTQELLEARKEDGAEQFFSRVDDFGYSKTTEETFEKWNKKEVLSDVVYIIRKFRPDVIVTRFPPDSRAGHGHHAASAILAEEAFKLAGDKTAYPEQLETVSVWQPARILWNTSVWWDKQIPEKAAKSPAEYIKINIGDYNKLLGLSYSEIAADSRSQHKSQGFGSARSRGNQLEFLKHTAGAPAQEDDLFHEIETSWIRVKGSKKVAELIDQLISTYNFSAPESSVKTLVELFKEIQLMPENSFKTQKLKDVKALIKAAAGVKAEALADQYNYNVIDTVIGQFVILQRSSIPITLKSVNPALDSAFYNIPLESNEQKEFGFTFHQLPGNSHPYWLPYESYKERMSLHADLRGQPEAGPIKTFKYTLNIYGEDIEFEEGIDLKWTDRVKGELHRKVTVSPIITLTPADKVYIFSSNQPQKISFLAEGNLEGAIGTVTLQTPKGWIVEPYSIELKFNFVGEQKVFNFTLTPPEKPSTGNIEFRVNEQAAKAVQRIEYDHILPQIMFPDATARIVKMDLAKTVKSIGYVKGSGDEVAQNLGSVGFNVVSFEAKDLAVMDLSMFETVIVGIRAYNTEPSMKNGNIILNEYVKNGGNVIVQYNTSRGIAKGDIGPYPFLLSRSRVTKEEAKPTFLAPKHPLLNTPNKLTEKDFENWVQERGLYFAGEWDPKYTPIIAWNDPGEDPQKGSILVADYGDGHFIFTGISFFRQLPAGVPGAYRLLTNMISYGK
ncbi:PIG-L family deacetylase [Vicingaceae bacterium]|nr:PIG-L family deacetylase [Vicingaceae bacterium]